MAGAWAAVGGRRGGRAGPGAVLPGREAGADVAALGAVAVDVSPRTGRPEISGASPWPCAPPVVGASGLFPVPSRGRLR